MMIITEEMCQTQGKQPLHYNENRANYWISRVRRRNVSAGGKERWRLLRGAHPGGYSAWPLCPAALQRAVATWPPPVL